MNEDVFKYVKQMGDLRKIPQFLFIQSIGPKAVKEVREKIQDFKIKNSSVEEIDFIVQSPGGSADDAYRIIRTLRSNFKTVNIIVPFWAKSAATLLSMGGSVIIMDEFGEFGPLDVQIAKEMDDRPDYERESALIDENSLNRIETRSRELFQKMFLDLYSSDHIHINKNELSKQILDYLAKFYQPLLGQINPYKLGDKKRKLDIGEQYARRILDLYNPNIPQDTKNIFIDFLVNGCPDHGYVIDYSVVSKFLPNVKQASEVSLDFETVLNNLSNAFISGKESEFIGFIVDNKAAEPVISEVKNS